MYERYNIFLAGLEISPVVICAVNTEPLLPQRLENQCTCGVCNKKCNKVWCLTKFYLHARRFLYKLDYNSKWNTQEKILPTSSQEEALIIKGKDQWAHGGTLAWASKQVRKRF